MEIEAIKNIASNKKKSVWEPNFSEKHVGICQGALGELYQGPSFHTDNEIVIISSLIPQYSWVYFTPELISYPTTQETLSDDDSHWKTFKALNYYCQINRLNFPKGHWDFKSELMVARGMASSTADIVAAIRCIANYYNRHVKQDELIHVLSKIERSDSVFLDELSLFCSSKHQVIMQFDKIPRIYALYMHEAEKVETDQTKTLLLEYYQMHIKQYSTLYQRMIQAFQIKNIDEICRISQLSSELSQGVIPKRHFNFIHEKISHFKADGLVIAHTGSAIGYLFRNKPDIETMEAVSLFFKKLGGDCYFTEIG